ncbi:unnamed protein product [Bursaphelenchus xylophilus]|uniref:Replication termination factor 2 n=1 Tax=Bursaphelenchus xylophilus TaxID=6326 RepID=A0A1I7RN35_BURXY|nr:unnamed protein product [Bursaphelenchus xylophilus]CAG9087650.1 unnamed protein product [Bursaphelenchus xylophilus]
MGADGGTIPKRCELVKKKKKAEKVERDVANAAKWKSCQLSNEPLKKPVVACRYGRLFNKEAILEAMLEKKLGQNEVTKHIKNRNDFKELKLTDNKDFKDGPDRGMVYKDHNDTQWICPVTALPMNGINVFKVNWICGCVVSEKAMIESKSETCLGCDGPVDNDKLVQLYPSEDVLEQYKQKHAEEIAAKKAKKAEKTKEKESAVEASTSLPEEEPSDLIAFKMPGGVKSTNHNKFKPSATAGVSEINERKRKLLLSKGSIQDDPNVSKAVKSLFTTSEEAKKQKTAHWVTHNPLYF